MRSSANLIGCFYFVDTAEWLLRVDTTSHWSAVMEALLQALEYRASEEALGLVLLRRWQRLDLDPVRLRASKGRLRTHVTHLVKELLRSRSREIYAVRRHRSR